MSVKEKGVSECILSQIMQFEKGSNEFSKVREAHGVEKVSDADFQFSVRESAGCVAEVTFVKEGGGNRVSGIYIKLDNATNIDELSKNFGEFKFAPPTPSKKWSAIAKYATESTAQRYAIIAEAREKITPNTALTTIKIRIDYAE